MDDNFISRQTISKIIDGESVIFDDFSVVMYDKYWKEYHTIMEQLWSNNYMMPVNTKEVYYTYKNLFSEYFVKNVKDIFLIYKNGTDNLDQNFINKYIKPYSLTSYIKHTTPTASSEEYKFLQMTLSQAMEDMVNVIVDILVTKIINKYNLFAYKLALNDKLYSNNTILNTLVSEYEDDASSILLLMYNKLKNLFTLERVQHNLHHVYDAINDQYSRVLEAMIPYMIDLFDMKYPNNKNEKKDPYPIHYRNTLISEMLSESDITVAISSIYNNKKIGTINGVGSLQDIIDKSVEDIDDSGCAVELVHAIIEALYYLLARVQADIY